MEYNQIICGKCEAVLQGFPDNSIDTIITDPPYGLSFMGKKWDYNVPSVEIWQECLRVLKPGGTLLCFAGSRTQHRMACNVEDAGFILKDCIMWLYGSGFPKATDISKQIDKFKRRDREVIGQEKQKGNIGYENEDYQFKPNIRHITAPATPEATLWNGWKSHGLKPAYEPILVAIKPNEGSYANNALKWGVSGLNINGARIEPQSEKDLKEIRSERPSKTSNKNEYSLNHGGLEGMDRSNRQEVTGRFPANIILDEESARLLDEQSGVSKSIAGPANNEPTNADSKIYGWAKYPQMHKSGAHFGDKGGASRFFYCAKASKSERNKGCEGLELKQTIGGGGTNNTEDDVCGKYGSIKSEGHNHHPTVKPLSLMKYLVTLTKMPNDNQVYLDPFAGSGTTLMACKELGRKYIGIEKGKDYCEIAECRLKATEEVLF